MAEEWVFKSLPYTSGHKIFFKIFLRAGSDSMVPDVTFSMDSWAPAIQQWKVLENITVNNLASDKRLLSMFSSPVLPFVKSTFANLTKLFQEEWIVRSRCELKNCHWIVSELTNEPYQKSLYTLVTKSSFRHRKSAICCNHKRLKLQIYEENASEFDELHSMQEAKLRYGNP